MSLIDLNHVRRTFDGGRIVAVDDVSLSIRQGETVAITGPSGSGKSTLLNLMCGLDRPTRGDIRFDSQSVRGGAKWARVRAERLGIVFQSFCLIPGLTAEENVEVAMIGQCSGVHLRRERALSLLQQVGLGDRSAFRPFELSGGERQRVAIARALANAPDVLMADEPTGSLDRRSSHLITDLLTDLQRGRHTTLVLVTHDQIVAGYCKRQIELVDGNVVSDVTVPPQAKHVAALVPPAMGPT